VPCYRRALVPTGLSKILLSFATSLIDTPPNYTFLPVNHTGIPCLILACTPTYLSEVPPPKKKTITNDVLYHMAAMPAYFLAVTFCRVSSTD